jgi:hypothetical protein
MSTLRKRFWVGRWLFHSLWSKSGDWTITRGVEQYRAWILFGPLDRPEGRAWVLTLGPWSLLFARVAAGSNALTEGEE